MHCKKCSVVCLLTCIHVPVTQLICSQEKFVPAPERDLGSSLQCQVSALKVSRSWTVIPFLWIKSVPTAAACILGLLLLSLLRLLIF